MSKERSDALDSETLPKYIYRSLSASLFQIEQISRNQKPMERTRR
jgi:hypothetical protein